MTRSSSSRLLDLDPKIDWTYRRKLKSAQEIVRNLDFEEHSLTESENQSSSVEDKSVTSENIDTNIMADNQDQCKTMVEYARPTLSSTGSSVVKPVIEANNFEIKASTMNMIHNQC